MRRRTRLVWRLFGFFTLIVCGTLVAAGWYFSQAFDAFFLNEMVVDLTARTRLVQALVAPRLSPLDAAAVDDICKRLGAESNTRYTVLLPSGAVVGDTWETPANMDNHAARPEVAGALARGSESSRRFSTTLQRNVLYVASSMHDQGRPVAVVRAAIPLSRIEEEMGRLRARFAGVGALIAGLALAVTLALSQRYGRRVRELQEGAARLAEGDLSQRLPAPDSEELAGLADSLNRMAAQIESRMQEVVRQRNQLEGVLSSMQEGVIAVDRDERVISMNPAAALLFELPIARARGRSLQEVIRNLAIQKFAARSLATGTPAEEDMAVFQNGERILNVRSAPLQGAGPETFGTLIVFNDVTQLRRLEDMRRDFVANVSHELKTPLTAIKGFVETLHQGQAEPEEARRFLGIVARHVDRLNVIIEDLLMLSRIEDKTERAEIRRETVRLNDVFANAVQICRPAADGKGIRIRVAGDPSLTASVDPVLMEQAVVNLLDNAVKYSNPEREVEVSVNATEREIRVSVRDQGMGIERRHLPRIFERFYRVDKARSRAVGGTGLGLAIVKHIAQAHGGHVSVESTVGEGSRFTIHLPRG
ncbi:MAG TPA: ATP-binding protein [Desulfobacterales bacterium]|nr:ATP-binding protein [Desulfobacterales bacterium]